VTEAEVGALCDSLATKTGWVVERYEQRRASKICAGIADRRYVKRGIGAIWIELKAPDGKLTEAQYEWCVAELHSGGLATVVDDVQTLAPLLCDAGRLSSMVRSSLRQRCLELLNLCAKRGWRRIP
jgi:hypothetical protein